MKRKIVVYAGYTAAPYNIDEVSSTPSCSGSEKAMMRLCEDLAKDEENEVIVCFDPIKEGTYCNVIHMSKENLKKYQEQNEIDVLIISRYVHYVFEMPLAKKNYVWVHDNTFHTAWNGRHFDDISVGRNIHKLFDGIVCVSNWHRNYLIERYKVKPEDQDRFIHIDNGIDLDNFYPIDMSKKQRGKIVFNCRTGGLQEAVNIFNRYKVKVPEAELHVFAQGDRMNNIKGDTSGVIDRGYVPNQTMIDELASAEYWVNPSPYWETFCIASLEAQLTRTLPIITAQAGMKETTNNYFVAQDPNLIDNLLNHGITYGDPETMLDENQRHATKYTWERCTNQFKELIS